MPPGPLTHPGTRGNILIPIVLPIPVPAPGLRSDITHRVKKKKKESEFFSH